MASPDQLTLLNDFAGRAQPSAALVARAASFDTAVTKLDVNPVRVHVYAANERDLYDRWPHASRLERAGIAARVVGRSAVAMASMTPDIIGYSITACRFEKQLKQEYGADLMVPPSNPEWSRAWEFPRPMEEYATALLRQHPIAELQAA